MYQYIKKIMFSDNCLLLVQLIHCSGQHPLFTENCSLDLALQLHILLTSSSLRCQTMSTFTSLRCLNHHLSPARRESGSRCRQGSAKAICRQRVGHSKSNLVGTSSTLTMCRCERQMQLPPCCGSALLLVSFFCTCSERGH